MASLHLFSSEYMKMSNEFKMCCETDKESLTGILALFNTENVLKSDQIRK